MSNSAPLPIIQRPVLLPLGDMPWDRFEAFAADLIPHLPGIMSHSCHRFGRAGQKQAGIDIFADRNDASRWAFSNKWYRNYSVSNVRKHIEETAYSAKRFFILVSTIAGTDVRNEVRQHSSWDIWDADDRSREVRELANRNSDAARRLVDTHFGSYWRKEFLGLPAAAAFLTTTDHFRPLVNQSRLFHHGYELVGRESEFQRLLSWEADSKQQVAILPGRGGIGKSRLVKALADELDNKPDSRHVRVHVESVPIDQPALDELPFETCLIIVDDAHRNEHLGLLLGYARQRTNLKVLLVSRLRGVERIQSELARAGFDTREFTQLPELRELTVRHSRTLAEAILGSDRPQLVDRLVRATGDCPLVTVIGARLLVDVSVPPELLDQHHEFRRAALERLCDEAIGQVRSGTADFTRQTLRVLSAVAPLSADDSNTMSDVCRSLRADEPDIRRLLDELESAGILVSRFNEFRITPDILADYLLHEACIGSKGRPTGFASRVPDEFALLAMRDAMAIQPKLASLPSVQQWIAQARAKGLFLAA